MLEKLSKNAAEPRVKPEVSKRIMKQEAMIAEARKKAKPLNDSLAKHSLAADSSMS